MDHSTSSDMAIGEVAVDQVVFPVALFYVLNLLSRRILGLTCRRLHRVVLELPSLVEWW